MPTDDRCDLLCLDLDVAEAIRLRATENRDAVEHAAALALGLSDPTRLSLAAALGEADELCVCDLAWIAGRSQNLVSHHLRALRGSGLAASRRQGKMVMYSLTDNGRVLVDTLLGDRVVAR